MGKKKVLTKGVQEGQNGDAFNFGPFIIKLCFYMSKELGLSLNVMYDKVLIGSV
jgi:hypothetical protein